MLLGQDLPADFSAEQLGVAALAVESGETVAIHNQAPQSCPQYFARVIEGVDNTRPTPLWLQERLRRAGLRTHDPLVDVTNYVMLLLGTPLHAFDAATISGGIVIRQAQVGEKLTLINGNEAVLDEKVLLIADAEKPLAIAGVMGWKRHGLSRWVLPAKRGSLHYRAIAPSVLSAVWIMLCSARQWNWQAV